MRTQDAIDCLKLFNAKFVGLRGSNFIKQLYQAQSGAILNWERGKGWDVVFVGPDDESIAAYILTLRLFIQKGERISLQKTKELYEKFPVLNNLKANIFRIYQDLEDSLNGNTQLSIQADGTQLSFRELFEFFLYGNLAHVYHEKHKIFTDISGELFHPLFKDYFIDVCVAHFGVICAFSEINEKAIAELEKEVNEKQ